MNIEFTDRYGGHAPSWLTACHECEAMGCCPDMPDDMTGIDLDGIPFVTCPACHGQTRVPLWRALARIPRWLYKGLRFTLYANKHCPGPASMSRWQNTVLAFKCAFLADLGLWKP